jgi:penicillin-binding protein 1A
VKTFLLTLILIPVALGAGIYGLFLIWGNHLPVPTTIEELQPSARSVVYDTNGETIGGYSTENRSPVLLSQVPPILIQAVLAAEDHRFYSHWGINAIAFARAAVQNVLARSVAQGASTITMQLARNLFLDQNRTLERKLKEIVLAIRIERSFSKDEILELYLNRIYFGEGAYGVQAAARRFFNRDIADLRAEEAAMLAGLPANPAAFSPVRHPQAALGRRNRVLRAMREVHVLSAEAYREAVNSPLAVSAGGSTSGAAPYFLEYVRLLTTSQFGSRQVYEGGLRIHTSLDLRLQRAAEAAIEGQCRKIEDDHLYRDTFESYRETGARAGGDGKTPYLQAALIALEPKTGRILAMVGGRSWQDSRFNRAVQARRQPGSSFKPFVYAVALKKGSKPNDIIVDEPVSYPMGALASMGMWSPKNFHNKYEGAITLTRALEKSINVPSVKLLSRLGPRSVVEFARTCGISGDMPPYLSLALGTAEVTPIEMASAYGAFDNDGILVEPVSIVKIEDRNGMILQQSRPSSSEALDEKTSAVLVGMMRAVVDHGTAYPARKEMGFTAPAAGKTGTTDDYSDAWFIGFVPNCVCAVWVGFDEKRTIGGGMTGAKAALPIWTEFMKAYTELSGEEDFVLPDGVATATICTLTGGLAVSGCPSASIVFIEGEQPHGYCTVHGGAPVEEEPPTSDEGW